MLLFDNETDIDFLYYESIATTIESIIKNKKDTPITIGVHGDWGAGKSSILKMLESSLEADEKIICLKFNGWLFQGFEDAKIALMESIVHTLQSNQKISSLIADEAKSLLKRINWLKLLKMGGNVAFNMLTSMPTPDQIEFAKNLIIKDPAANIEKALSIFDPKEEKSIPEEMHAFREEFKKLLDKAKIKKLVVLIDDLDRCLPKTAIETLEAIRLFLFVDKTIFIIAADEGMIEAAVKEHFPEPSNSTGPTNYARNYLEKLIQVPFRLPSLGASETKTYVTLSLLEGLLDGDSFNKLLEISKLKLQKPWENSGLTLSEIKETVGKINKEAEERIILSEQICPMLSEGTKGNPRQIKRFINSLLLRLEIAKNRNFIDVINKEILAKLMLLEYFSPEIYSALAQDVASSNEGIAQVILTIEEQLSEKRLNDLDPKLKRYTDHQFLLRWVGIGSKFGNTDLRPYIFISKDKQPGLFLTNIDERIIKLYKILTGSEFEIKSCSEALRNITIQDGRELFDLLATRIKETISKDDEPQGYQGLKKLISIFPELQYSAIELIKTFNIENIGVWILYIMDSFETEYRQKFTEIIVEWSQKNEILAAALTAGMDEED